jgi:hypothetical protein
MSSQLPIAESQCCDKDALCRSDATAVLEQFASGHLVEAGVAERVRARTEQVTDNIRRERGLVDDDTFQSLLDDEA